MDVNNTTPKKLPRLLRGFILLFILVLLPVWAWSIEPRLLLTREVTVTSPDLPPAFDGVRIAFLTDIHRGPAFSEARVRKVVEKTNALAPDLVLLGGDYVAGGPEYIQSAIAPLAGLRAPLGKFAVLGNHDYWYSAPRARDALAAAGIDEIENRGVWVQAPKGRGGGDPSLPSRIRIAGVGDLWEGTQDLAAALGDARPDDFVILLSHNPDFAAKLPVGAVDLMLSGHTHGGQVTVFGLFAPVLPIEGGQRLRSGVIQQGSTTIIVSRGIGLIAPNIRFCCPPEIVVVTLRRK